MRGTAALTAAHRLLLVPDLIGHWLFGVQVTEQTNASTTGLLDVQTHRWAPEVRQAAGLDPAVLAPLVTPGEVLGPLHSLLAAETGLPQATLLTAVVRCIVESLASTFALTLANARELSGRDVDVVHLVGGGALNELLCQLTANACGLPVLAGPVEATALGNVLVQARAHGAVTGDLGALRRLVLRTQQIRRYEPTLTARIV